MAEVNEELVACLKLCKTKELEFAFVGPESNGTLILAKKPGSKVPKDDIDAAKKAMKSNALVKGRCLGPIGDMVFKVMKPKATLAAAIKKAVFRDTKLTVKADIQQLIPQPGDDDWVDTAAATPVAAAAVGAAASAAAAAVAPTAPPAPAPSEPRADAAAKPPTVQEMAVLEDRRRDFKKARAAWVAVKIKAEEDLEKVKDGARMTYVADATQFPKIVKGCKDIDDILDNLDDELRDTLDQYASTPLKNQIKLRSLAATATRILDRYGVYVDSNPVLKAIDAKEFADVVIHAPIKKALADLRKALS